MIGITPKHVRLWVPMMQELSLFFCFFFFRIRHPWRGNMDRFLPWLLWLPQKTIPCTSCRAPTKEGGVPYMGRMHPVKSWKWGWKGEHDFYFLMDTYLLNCLSFRCASMCVCLSIIYASLFFATPPQIIYEIFMCSSYGWERLISQGFEGVGRNNSMHDALAPMHKKKSLKIVGKGVVEDQPYHAK